MPRSTNPQDAKQHLERLVELLQTPKTAEDGSRNRSASNCYNSKPSGELGTLAMALGNLGVVCHELGEADRASETLEESLKSASFLAASSARHVTTWLGVDGRNKGARCDNATDTKVLCVQADLVSVVETTLEG